MNKLANIALCTAAILSLAPSPAMAGSKERAAIGGFIGGLIIGHAITDSYRSTCPPEPGYVVVHDGCRGTCCGHWKETRIKVWVPGYWDIRYHHGNRVRFYVAGRHEWRVNRIWIADSRGSRHGTRDHRYAYNR